MMKKIVILFLGIVMAGGVQAQISWLHYPNGYLFPAATPEKYYYDQKEQEKKEGLPGIRYRLDMGGSFTTSPWYKGFSTWVAPGFSYTVTPRFFISGGVRVEQYFPTGGSYLSPGGEQGFAAGPATNMVIYASGTYLIRPNLSVTGTMMKNLDINKNISPYGRRFNYVPDSYSLRFDYQLSPGIHLGAEFRYTDYSRVNPFAPGGMYPGPYRGYTPFGYGW